MSQSAGTPAPAPPPHQRPQPSIVDRIAAAVDPYLNPTAAGMAVHCVDPPPSPPQSPPRASALLRWRQSSPPQSPPRKPQPQSPPRLPPVADASADWAELSPLDPYLDVTPATGKSREQSGAVLSPPSSLSTTRCSSSPTDRGAEHSPVSPPPTQRGTTAAEHHHHERHHHERHHHEHHHNDERDELRARLAAMEARCQELERQRVSPALERAMAVTARLAPAIPATALVEVLARSPGNPSLSPPPRVQEHASPTRFPSRIPAGGAQEHASPTRSPSRIPAGGVAPAPVHSTKGGFGVHVRR